MSTVLLAIGSLIVGMPALGGLIFLAYFLDEVAMSLVLMDMMTKGKP